MVDVVLPLISAIMVKPRHRTVSLLNIAKHDTQCQKYFRYIFLSYDVASGSDIPPCIKIDKPLLVYRFL